MSELVAHKADVTIPVYGTIADAEVYLKSEADKVIAELKDKARHYPMMAALLENDKKEIAELKDKLQAADEQIENLINSASSIMLFQDRVTDDKCAELRYQKYKRCLAMAYVEWLKQMIIGNHPESILYRRAFRREHKWRRLAEKFEEAK